MWWARRYSGKHSRWTQRKPWMWDCESPKQSNDNHLRQFQRAILDFLPTWHSTSLRWWEQRWWNHSTICWQSRASRERAFRHHLRAFNSSCNWSHYWSVVCVLVSSLLSSRIGYKVSSFCSYSSDCVSCRRIFAIWEGVGAVLKRKMNVARVNRLQGGILTAKRFNIDESPVFLLIRQGKVYRYKGKDLTIKGFVSFIDNLHISNIRSEPVPPVTVSGL